MVSYFVRRYAMSEKGAESEEGYFFSHICKFDKIICTGDRLYVFVSVYRTIEGN